MTQIQCPLQQAAQISGRQPALVREGLTLNFSQLNAQVSATAEKLRQLPVRPGEHVGIFLPNDWMYPVFFFALLRIGAVACPLNTRLPREGLRDLLQRISCRKLISITRGRERHKRLWEADIYDPEPLLGVEGTGSADPGRYRIDLMKPATILCTSGSAGEPKAVVHSYGNHYYSALGSNANIRLGSGNRWLVVLPFYHVSGLSILFRCLLAGAAVVLPGEREPIEEAMATYRVTHLSLVATQLQRLIRDGADPAAFNPLQAVLAGGSAISPAVIDRCRALRIPLFTTYGLTEMASQVTTTRVVSPPAKRHTSGAVLKHREVRIGEGGEILVRGDTLFIGYHGDGELRRPLTEDGWFATGDIGRLDGDGYLTVTGRRDNLFISGGENIYPEEIEEALCRHEQVRRAVVAPVADAEYGHRPVAFVLTSDVNGHGLMDFRPFLEECLPRFKIPIAFYAWPNDADPEEAKVNRPYFAGLAQSLRTPAR